MIIHVPVYARSAHLLDINCDCMDEKPCEIYRLMNKEKQNCLYLSYFVTP